MIDVKVRCFTMHDNYGNSILKKDWISWIKINNGSGKFRGVKKYSWYVGDKKIVRSVDASKVTWDELPDASGFICFESGLYPNNCYVLDVYGEERYTLTVPWELVLHKVPSGLEMWFRGVGSHIDGEYGVTAWIEGAGDFYFELDYHKGQFLWGKEIRF